MGDALRISRSAAMRLRTHRDESRSRRFDLTGGGSHPWSIDLVVVTVSALLVVGFGPLTGENMDRQTKREIWLLTIGTIIVEIPVAFAAFTILSH
jgi:hypothetical protein